jgi:hypothetical protein
MNTLLILLRILSGIILIMGYSIGYLITLTISTAIIANILLLLCNINIISYDIIWNLVKIMILGIYDDNNLII